MVEHRGPSGQVIPQEVIDEWLYGEPGPRPGGRCIVPPLDRGQGSRGRQEGQEQLRAAQRPGMEASNLGPQWSEGAYIVAFDHLHEHAWVRGTQKEICFVCKKNPANHARINAEIRDFRYPPGTYVRAVLELREALVELGEELLKALPRPLRKLFERAMK